jgi:hypothetical protein
MLTLFGAKSLKQVLTTALSEIYIYSPYL